MQTLRRFFVACLIWVGLLPGRQILRAQSAVPPTAPASRAQNELDRQAEEYWRKNGGNPSPAARSEQEARAKARALVQKQTTAPGPKVRYATTTKPRKPLAPNADEIARQERLAQ